MVITIIIIITIQLNSYYLVNISYYLSSLYYHFSFI